MLLFYFSTLFHFMGLPTKLFLLNVWCIIDTPLRPHPPNADSRMCHDNNNYKHNYDNNEYSSYSCYCIDGYTGIQCQTNWDECWSGPCQNGGTCVDGVAYYNCTCPEGFSGKCVRFIFALRQHTDTDTDTQTHAYTQIPQIVQQIRRVSTKNLHGPLSSLSLSLSLWVSMLQHRTPRAKCIFIKPTQEKIK